MKEFTGDYEHCMDCGYTWDFMETHCPECGSQNLTEMNAKEVKSHYALTGEPEFSRVVDMLDLHGD